MACVFKVTIGEEQLEFETKELLNERLKEEVIRYKDSSDFHSETLANPLMLIPDFTTKLKVDFNDSEIYLNYNELITFIEKTYGDKYLPESVLMSALEEKSYSANGNSISISIPDVSINIKKKFQGFSLNGLPSDVIVEARILIDDDVEIVSGPVSYVRKMIGDSQALISIMEREIESERELQGMDYTFKDKEGVEYSIRDTKVYDSLWEQENKRPRYNGKFSDSIITAFLSYNNKSIDDISAIIAKYNNGMLDDEVSEGVTVIALTKDVVSFLKSYNVPVVSEEQSESMTYLQRVTEDAKRNREITRIDMSFRSIFRKDVISEIKSNPNKYTYKHSEAVGTFVNAAKLGMRAEDTIQYIENRASIHENKEENSRANALAYFAERLQESEYIKNIPLNNIFNGDVALDNEQLANFIKTADFSELESLEGFKDFKNQISNILLSSVENFTQAYPKVIELFNDNAKGFIDRLAVLRTEAYFKSKKIVTTRIPSQGKQSSSVSILKIIDNSGTNYIHEAVSNFIIKGQDNDGDKLNTLTSQLDKHGVVVDYTKYLDENGKFDGIDINNSSNFAYKVLIARRNERINIIRKDGIDVEALDEFVNELEVINQMPENDDKIILIEDFYSKLDKFLMKKVTLTEEEQSNIVDKELSLLSDNKLSHKFKTEVLDVIDERSDAFLSEKLKGLDNAIDKSKIIASSLRGKIKAKEIAIADYKAAMLNYIIDQQIKSFETGINAIEKEIPVDNRVTNQIAEGVDINSVSDTDTEDEKVKRILGKSILNVASDINTHIAAESEIAKGNTMVGVTANFISMANTMKEISSSLEDGAFQLYRGEPIDLSYILPVFDSEGNKSYAKKKVVISEMQAFSQSRKVTQESMDALFNVKGIDESIEGHVNYIKSMSEYNDAVEDKVALKGLLDKADSLSEAEITEMLFKQQVWEDFSELMTGAVDNAKLLVLSKLGIDNSNAKYIFTMILYGVSIVDAVAIIRQPDIAKANMEVGKAKNNHSITSLAGTLKGVAVKRANNNKIKKNKQNANLQLVSALESYGILKEYYAENFNAYGLEIITVKGQFVNGALNSEGFDTTEVTAEDVRPDMVDDVRFTRALSDSDTVLFTYKNGNEFDVEDKKFNQALESGKKVFVSIKGDTYIVKGGNITKLDAADEMFYLTGKVFVYSPSGDITNTDALITRTNKIVRDQVKTESKDKFLQRFKKGYDSAESKVENIDHKYDSYDTDFNPAKNLLEFSQIIDEVSTIAHIVSFKNGKTNSAYDSRSFVTRANGLVNKIFAKSKLYEDIDFDIIRFSIDDKYRADMIAKYQEIKKGFNPLLVLSQAVIPMQYLKSVGTTGMMVRLADDISIQNDVLYKRLFKYNNPSMMVASQLKAGINGILVMNYIKSSLNTLDSVTIDGKDISLLTKEGQHEFMVAFPKYLQDIRKTEGIIDGKLVKLEDNFFLKNLRFQGYPSEELGITVDFIGLDDDVVDNDKSSTARLAAKKLEQLAPEFYKALFIYDQLQSGGSFNKKNMSSLMNPQMSVDFNKANETFDFNNISDIDLNYLILLKPGLYSNMNKDMQASISVAIDRGIITAPLTINGTEINVPIVRSTLSQTGSDIITMREAASMRTIIEKAGYKAGFEVEFNDDKGLAHGRVVAFNETDDNYFVESADGKVYNVPTSELKELNNEMRFDGHRFGPDSKFKELDDSIKITLTYAGIKRISRASARYEILGKNEDISNRYEEGQVLETQHTSNGSVYQLVYKGVVTPGNAGVVTSFLNNENKFYADFTVKDANYYKGGKNVLYGYAQWVAVKKVKNPFDGKVVFAKTLKSLHLYKQITATSSDRSPFIYAPVTSEKYSKLKLSRLGDRVSANVGKRLYTLTNRAMGKTWLSVASQLNIDTSNPKVAKDKLAALLSVDRHDTKSNQLLVKFFNYDPSTAKDDVLDNMQDIAFISAVPEGVSGANNTYEEQKTLLTKEDQEFKSNISKDIKVIKKVNISESHKTYGTTIISPSVSNDTDGIEALVTEDFATLLNKGDDSVTGVSVALSNVPSIIDAIKNSEAVVVEMDTLLYASDSAKVKDSLLSENANIRTIQRAKPFVKNARIDGYIDPIDQLEFIDKLHKGELSTELQEKYKSIIEEDYDIIVKELESAYELKPEGDTWVYNPSKGFDIGKTRRAYSEKMESFVALQTAKYYNEFTNDKKDIFVYSKNDEAWFSYNYITGTFSRLSEIPRIYDNISYLGESDQGLDLMLKSTSLSNDKAINPSFIYSHDFIVDENQLVTSDKDVSDENLPYELIEDIIGEDDIQEVTKIISYQGLFENEDGTPVEDMLDFSKYTINTYEDGLVTIESDDENYLYIIGITEEKRKDYDEIGETVSDITISFDKNETIAKEGSVFSIKGALKVKKDSFAYRGTTSDVNTSLNKLKNNFIKFVDKKHDVEGFSDSLSIRDMATILQAEVAKNKSARDLRYNNIYNYNDFVNQLKRGALNDYIPAKYNNITTALIKYNEELNSKKDAYRKSARKASARYSRDIVNVNATEYNDSDVKVFFTNHEVSDRDVAGINSEIITVADVGVLGFHTSNQSDKEGRNVEVTTFGVNIVPNYDKRLSNVLDMFAKIRNEGKPTYISFGEVYDAKGNMKEIYPGVTYEEIAKHIAKAMRIKANKSMTSGDNPLVTFDESAAKLVNSTDGVFTMSNINSNKIYDVVTTIDNAFRVYNVRLENMMSGEYSLMQKFNNAIGLGYDSDNTYLQTIPVAGSLLHSKTPEFKQQYLDKLIENYYRVNSNELTDFMRKLNGRNIYSKYKGTNVFSLEQSMVNLVNTFNSIDFILKKEITSLPYDPDNTQTFALLPSDIQSLEVGEERAFNSATSLYKVRAEFKLDSSNIIVNGKHNDIIAKYGLILTNAHIEHISNGGSITIVSNIPFGDKVEFNAEKLKSEDFDSRGYTPINNLDEGSMKESTVVLLLNTNGSVITKNGLERSTNLQEISNSFDGGIVANIVTSDIITIKTPNFGDTHNATKENFYDAFVKIKPYLDNITNKKAKVILSGGVTVNEYIKNYLLNAGYTFNSELRMYTADGNSELQGSIVYKVSENNSGSFIGNDEKGLSGLPFIVSTDSDKAKEHKSTEIESDVREFTYINTSKIKETSQIIDESTVSNILEEYKPSSFSSTTNNAIRVTSEQNSVYFLKLAVAVSLIDDANIPTDINQAISYIYEKLSSDKDLEIAYRSRLKGIVSEDGYGDVLDSSLPNIAKFNMTSDFNSLKVYLKEVLHIDISKITEVNPNFKLISEVFKSQKIYEGAKVYKQYLREEDFDIREASVLDLFLFSTIVDPNVSFDGNGNIDFGSVPHVFVKNGINGIKLDDGNTSLFETMGLFNNNHSSPLTIAKPEGKVKRINNVISNIYDKLASTKKYNKMAIAINSTNKNDIPFTVIGDVIYYNTFNGKIKEFNINADGALRTLEVNLTNTVADSVLSKIGLSLNNNDELLLSGNSFKYNVSNALKNPNGLDKIDINNVLFTTLSNIDIKNVPSDLDRAIAGDIYMKDGIKGIVLRNAEGKVFVTEDGKMYNEQMLYLNDLDNIVNTKASTIDLANEVKPSDKLASGTISFINNDEKVELAEVTIDEKGDAYNDSQSFTYNYNLNSWVPSEESSYNFKLTRNINRGNFGSVTVVDGKAFDKEGKGAKQVKALSLSNGLLAYLSEDAVATNSHTITDGDMRYSLNSNRLTWNFNFTDSEGEIDNAKFKFRSFIDTVKIGNKSFQAKKVSKKSIIKILEYFNDVYPEQDINAYSADEIREVFSSDKAERAAFVYEGSIVFNTDMLTFDSPVHELAHLYIADIKSSNPELYARLLEKAFENTELMNEVKSKGNFISTEEIAEETLVLMIGYNSQGKMENLIKDKTIWQSIKDFFSNLFNGIFKVQDVTVTDTNSSIVDIISTISDDVLFGTRNIFSEFDIDERNFIKEKVKPGNIGLILNKLKSKGFIKAKPREDIRRITNSNIKCD